MPYYCTVPRCTSMAGKTKNVSFHQFPRDEELAILWNNILKRGKPYTKYSKVCSLHFKSEDYTVTSGQKNKGSWRTLKKNAIPSRNLPTDWPSQQQQSSSKSPPPMVDPRMHHQMAQAIYVQTMLAMQAASIIGFAKPELDNSDCLSSASDRSDCNSPLPSVHPNISDSVDTQSIPYTGPLNKAIYKCSQCSKCFKDPDVFVLHQRTHSRDNANVSNSNDHTLRANPILANLLERPEGSRMSTDGVFNVSNIHSIENQIMMALTANMENYLQNLDSIMTPLSLITSGQMNVRDVDHRPHDGNEKCQNVPFTRTFGDVENRNGIQSDEFDEPFVKDGQKLKEDLNEVKKHLNKNEYKFLEQHNSVEINEEENNSVIDKTIFDGIANVIDNEIEILNGKTIANKDQLSYIDNKYQEKTSY